MKMVHNARHGFNNAQNTCINLADERENIGILTKINSLTATWWICAVKYLK